VDCPYCPAQNGIQFFSRCGPARGGNKEVILIIEFVSGLFAISETEEVLGTLSIETQDLHDAVQRARIVLSSKDFKPAVAGFRVLVNGDELVYREHRGDADVLEPVNPA